jgi:hypothetical protein
MIEPNSRNRRLCAFKNNILHLLHVDVAGPDFVEDVRENARSCRDGVRSADVLPESGRRD